MNETAFVCTRPLGLKKNETNEEKDRITHPSSWLDLLGQSIQFRLLHGLPDGHAHASVYLSVACLMRRNLLTSLDLPGANK